MATATIARSKAQKAAGMSLTESMAANAGKSNTEIKSSKAPAPTTPTSKGGTSGAAPLDVITDDTTKTRYSRNPADKDSKYSLYTGPSVAPTTPVPLDGASEPMDAPETPKPEDTTSGAVYSRYGGASYQAPEVQTADQIQRQKGRAAQSEINALRNEENSMLQEQAVLNDKSERGSASVSTLTGLGGSDDANTRAAGAGADSRRANDTIRTHFETKIQTVLSEIRKEAITEARQQRLDARDDETAYYANQKAKQELANNFVKNIASSGITLTGLKTGDPKSYQYMVDQFGSEEALRGAFILNTPQEAVLDKQIKGGKYIIAKQNPVTGKVTVETIDLGLPDTYTDTIDAGDRILAVPENWSGDVNDLISIDKGLSPDEAAKNASSGVEGYDGQFGATVNLISSTGTTKDQRAVLANNMKEFIANGDYASAYALVVQAAASKLKGAASSDFTEKIERQTVVADLASALEEYEAAGGNTNIFKGTEDKIQTRIGDLYTDPEYAAIATQLDSAFQAYRQQMTGAAFGAQESREYASVLPGKGNTLDLNTAKMKGYNAYLDSSIKGSLRSAGLGQGAIHIKERAEGALGSDGSGGGLTPDEIQGYRDLNPGKYGDMSDEEIQGVVGDSGGGDFSSVGKTTASANRPQRNRNPGNVKVGGIGDKYAKKGADGKPMTDEQGHLIFPTVEAGLMAVKADIGAKIAGRSDAAFRKLGRQIATLTDLNTVYAEDQNWKNNVITFLGKQGVKASPSSRVAAIPREKLINAVMQAEGFFA